METVHRPDKLEPQAFDDFQRPLSNIRPEIAAGLPGFHQIRGGEFSPSR